MVSVRVESVVILFVCLCAGGLLTVAVVMPYWHSEQLTSSISERTGLWQICQEDAGTGNINVMTCVDITHTVSRPNGAVYLWASQSLSALSMATALVSLVTSVVNIVLCATQCSKLIGITALGTSIFASVAVVLYSCGFLLREQQNFVVPNGWAFWLMTGTAIVYAGTGVTVLLRNHSRQDTQSAENK